MPRLRVVALVAALGVACAAPEPSRPSFVLVSVDTLSRTALRAFEPGAPPHPALDAFAAESSRFGQALSTAAWTLPAHASLLTGLYPDRHGATDPRVGLSPAAPTLAEALSARGYETVAFTDGGYLDRAYGLDRGFDRWDAHAATPAGAALDGLPRDGAPSAPPGEALFDRAIAYLAQRASGAPPFLLLLHTYAVHDYFALRPWTVDEPEERRSHWRGHFRACVLGRRSCPEQDWQRLREIYALEVAHLDAGFARLLEALGRSGLADTTVMVVTSDHGEGFEPERGRTHHGGRLHHDQLRIPLLVRVPGRSGGDVDAPVSLADVAPTVLELAGGRADPALDGRSFAGLLRGEPAPPPRPLYAMEHHGHWVEGRPRQSHELRDLPLALAVVDGADWYVDWRLPGRGAELYDMQTDPGQARNLAGQGGVALERLRSAARSRREPRAHSPRLARTHELDERLRELGYVE